MAAAAGAKAEAKANAEAEAVPLGPAPLPEGVGGTASGAGAGAGAEAATVAPAAFPEGDGGAGGADGVVVVFSYSVSMTSMEKRAHQDGRVKLVFTGVAPDPGFVATGEHGESRDRDHMTNFLAAVAKHLGYTPVFPEAGGGGGSHYKCKYSSLEEAMNHFSDSCYCLMANDNAQIASSGQALAWAYQLSHIRIMEAAELLIDFRGDPATGVAKTAIAAGHANITGRPATLRRVLSPAFSLREGRGFDQGRHSTCGNNVHGNLMWIRSALP